MNNSKITEMKKLIEQLKKANYAYYQLDEPIMSDRDYNVMYEQLEMLEKETGIVLSDSPTQKVGSVAKKLIKPNRCVIIKKKCWS